MEMSHWRSDGPGSFEMLDPWQARQAMHWLALRAEGLPSVGALCAYDVARILSGMSGEAHEVAPIPVAPGPILDFFTGTGGRYLPDLPPEW